MKKPFRFRRIRIHREGRRIILGYVVAVLMLNLFMAFIAPVRDQFIIWSVGISLLSATAVIMFFRNPKRLIAYDEEAVIAPADGKIVAIEEVYEGEYFKDKRIQVSVFMSPANVHVNRTPIGGTVKYVKYHPGKYLVAWHPKSSEKNERNSVVIENEGEGFSVLIRQIAGALARRIVNYLDEGDEVTQGMELGFIKFGSRVDLFLPAGTKINVAINQKVKGGETVIAEIEDIDDDELFI